MTRFRHNCATVCWLKKRWDSNAVGQVAAEVDGVWPFPRGSSPGDIDAFLECAGSVLFIETKAAGAPMSRGQKRALESLAELGAVVLLQECDPPSKDFVVQVRFCLGAGRWEDWRECDRLGRDRLVQAWFERAEGQRRAA